MFTFLVGAALLNSISMLKGAAKPDPTKWPLGHFPDENPYFPLLPRDSRKGSGAVVVRHALCAATSVIVLIAAILAGQQARLSRDPDSESLNKIFAVVAMSATLAGLCFSVLWLGRSVEYRRFHAWRLGKIFPARVVNERGSPINIVVYILGAITALIAHGHILLPRDLLKYHNVVVEFVDGGGAFRLRIPRGGYALQPGQYLWIARSYWPWPISMVHLDGDGDWRKTPIPDEVCAWLDASLRAAREGRTSITNRRYEKKPVSY